ncbi:MAG TPA: MFS transporter [Acidimicrobiales bacterium]|jgi:EmrB/QacA subfamily drug resistance transporter
MPASIHDRRWWILTVLCLIVIIVVIDNTIVNVALPVISSSLHASNSSLQWVVDAYSLPFAGLLLAGGGLSDRLGRKRVMQMGLASFGAFSVLAAFSHDVTTLLVARALMGASAAFIFPATLSTLTITFADAKERAKAFGAWGAASGVAIAIGPVVGGSLLVHFWYGSIFLINAPLVAVALIASAYVMPESKSPLQRRVDIGGLILGTAGVTLLTLATIQGPTWGWHSASILGLYAVGALAVVGFVRYELHRKGPLVDVRVFSNRAFSAGAGAIAMNYFALFGFIFLITQYLQLVRGYSPLSAGVHTLPFAAVVMVATPASAVLALKWGARYVVAAGLAIVGVALFWGSVVSAHAAYFGPVVAMMMLLAFGFSLVNAPSTASLMGTLRPEQVGAGAAVNETTRELAGTLGVAVVGSIFSSFFGPGVQSALERYVGHGLTTAQLHLAMSSTPAAQATIAHFPAALRPALNNDVTSAFMSGLHHGCLVAGAVALIAAVLVLRRMPSGLTAENDQPALAQEILR